MDRRILVVDDENLARTTLASIIKKNIDFECEIIECSNGYEAVEMCKTQNSQVIVFMDIKMPGLSGIEASEKILELNPNCIIYIVTAYDYFHYIQHALEIGVKGYILKPPNADDVIKKIDKAFFSGYPKSLTDTNELQEPVNVFFEESEYKYPSENEHIFLEKIKFMQIDDAYTAGYAILDYFFTMKDNIPLMREFVCEFFVILNRQLMELRQDIDRSFNYEFIEACPKMNDFEQIKRLCINQFEKYFVLLNEINQKKNSIYIQSALKIVERELSSNISLENIARELSLTPQYFSRLFKEQTGINFIDFVIEKKIKKAKILLQTTQDSIKSICHATGYDDLNYFSRIFKKITGLTPTEYRFKSNSYL